MPPPPPPLPLNDATTSRDSRNATATSSAVLYLLGGIGSGAITSATDWNGPALYQHTDKYDSRIVSLYNGKTDVDCHHRQLSHASVATSKKGGSRMMCARNSFPSSAVRAILLVPLPPLG